MTRTSFHTALVASVALESMDVPYNKSGASSRAHYQIVRNVENAPQQSEKLLVQEVERIRKHFASKMLSTSEIRKDLIILLYCLNTSFGSINSTTLAFALPSAAHLAEAGSRVSEKRMGYMFCWEVMPREHELQLMLVNTIRKDLTSPSVAKINLALESLVNLPSLDVIPAVHTRCIGLLSHPSPRIRALTMIALHSLSQTSPELLNDGNMKQLVVKRLSDADESVVRTALRLGLAIVSGGLLESEEILRSSTSLVSRIVDKHTTRNYSSAFTLSVLNTISRLLERDDLKSKVDYVNELLPPLLGILRRAVKHGQQSLILECFRLTGRFPTNIVAQYILKMTLPSTEPDQQGEGSDRQRQHFVHPVARIRHFLSSRTVNDHYLFLSCLVCLHPSLWAGTTQSSENLLNVTTDEQQTVAEMENPALMQPVLDQLEVERVLSFLDSEDEQIRALTLRLLISLDPSLVESCYQRVLNTLRSASPNSTNDQARSVILQRLVEFAFTICLGNEKIDMESRGRILLEKLKEVIDVAGARDTVNKTVVESILSRVRRERPSNQGICILNLLTILQAEDTPGQAYRQPLDKTLFLILVALTCELASIFALSMSEVVSMICLFATTLHTVSELMQEPILLCMTRLAVLLSASEVSSQEMEDVRRVVHELGETSLEDKKRAMILKRSRQFEKILSEPSKIRERLGNGRSVSLPEFALMLDGADSTRTPPRGNASTEPSSPPFKVSSPTMSQSELVRLSQSKLRYDAYAPPTSPNRIARVHSHSSSVSGRSSNRASSRASSTRTTEFEDEPDLSRTVTAGELTLAAGSRNEFARMYRDKKGKTRESESVSGDAISPDTTAKKIPDLLTIDSPFLAEPLVDVDAHPSPPSPYVSANTSLRTSPEPGQNFEQLWSELTATPEAFNARGWCEDATDIVVRRLQSMGSRMDVLSVDDTPFLGDLKIMLHSSSIGSFDSISRALLRLHEEDDGSCRWQVRCTDRELGLKVKELLD